jgi:hypothetical protein
MSKFEIDIVKKCASIIAKKYDPLEPWASPNSILLAFNLTPWERLDDAWYDPETGANYHFG